MNNEIERNQYIAQLKPSKIVSGYDDAKRLIRKYFTEFGKLAEDRKPRRADQKSKFSFFHFLQIMELPGKKELFSELMSTTIVLWGTTLLIFLFDKIIKTCGNLINESFDVLMRRLGWKIRIRSDFLLLFGVYLIYPAVKYLQKRKPDLSFAGFESD